MTVLVGNARHLPLPEGSVDAIVTDPPYGWSFMGRDWDSDVPGPEYWKEALRVAKPGAYMVAWIGPRTSHHLAVALERAGWKIRDKLMHLFGSGFPKSHDISKAIDAAAGFTRDLPRHSDWSCTPGTSTNICDWCGRSKGGQPGNCRCPKNGNPHTEAAKRWHGFGTALKPAYEEGWLCQKPREGTYAQNVLEHGVGGLNIDGTRVPIAHDDGGNFREDHGQSNGGNWGSQGRKAKPCISEQHPAGRWPPHLLLTHDARCGARCVPGCPVRELDRQSGPAGGGFVAPYERISHDYYSGGWPDGHAGGHDEPGSGGASRFFPRFRYCAKASRAEREAGLAGFARREADVFGDDEWGRRERGVSHSRNHHPTVKPLDLMRWLVRLVTPPNGLVLDPFMGSGTTGCAAVLEGMRFVGLDLEPEYVAMARARIAYWRRMGDQPLSDRETYTSDDPAQADLFAEAAQAEDEEEAA